MTMTKRDLKFMAENVCFLTDCTEHKLGSCQAKWRGSVYGGYATLYSYGTVCAIYYARTVFEFDRWSNTTTSHVRKFALLMDAPVISLYRRSCMSKRDYDAHTACDWQDVIDAVLNT